MKTRPLILSLLLILSALPLRAQWSGRVDFSTGLGGMNGNKELDVGFLGHLLTKGDASLRYQTEKFSWTTSVNARLEPKSSDNSRVNFSTGVHDELEMELVYKTVKTQPLQVGARTEFEFRPARERSYAAWVSYQYKNDRARNVSNSLSGTLSLTEEQRRHYYEYPRELVDGLTLDEMDSYLASCYYEIPRLDEHSMGTGARGDWKLGDKSLLQGSFSLSTTSSRKNTTSGRFSRQAGRSRRKWM